MRSFLAGLRFILPLILLSCTQNEKTNYYPTGEIKFRAPIDEQGVYNGEVIYYYRNGNIQAQMPFYHHHINGIVRKYYSNGILESTEECRNGVRFGKLKQYYPTGQLKYEAVLHGKINTDTARYYHANGELKEVIVYDSKGRKVDFGVWHSNGRIDTSYTRPIFLSDTDNLLYGQDYSFEITLANRRSKAVIIKFLNPKGNLDSTSGALAKTRYIIRKPILGTHQIKARVYQRWLQGDTLYTNWYRLEHLFYVRRK